jgi:hypothetical protein
VRQNHQITFEIHKTDIAIGTIMALTDPKKHERDINPAT